MAVTDKVSNQSTKSLKSAIDNPPKGEYNDTVSILCLIDGIVSVVGTATGKTYIFPRAGTPVAVDIQDKDELLNKKKGRSCCGGQSFTNVFQLAE